jgi:DNA polymerase-3 subunit delta'
MSLQSIAGQDRAVRTLLNSLRERRLSHAYLFSGPPGTGKRRAALCFAKAILCAREGDDACGRCAECRKVDSGNHTALTIIEPDGAFIKIEQIRALQREFAYRTASGRPKVAIIVHADRMTTEAANSLLKFLEEPTEAAVAILVSDNGHAVLPTLLSRCQRIDFVLLPPQVIYNALLREGCSDELARSAAHLVGGLDSAREIAQFNGFAGIRNVVIQLMKEHISDPARASITVQNDVLKQEWADRLDLLLGLMILWFKDLIHIQSGRRDRIVFTDQTEWLARQAFTREPSAWIACMELVLEAGRRLKAHVNAQLVLEQLLIRIGSAR